MLDISKVLNRSWHILWKYRILWIFGMFLAMAAGGYSGSNFNWSQRYPGNGKFWTWDSGQLGTVLGKSGNELVNLLIICGIVLLVVVLFWSVVSAFLKYVSEVAAIRAANDYEDTGVKLGFKQLWKIGWTKSAWHVFLINLLLSLPFIAITLFEGLMGVWVYFASQSSSEGYKIFTVITVAGLTFFFMAVGLLLAIAISVIGKFAARVCVLEGAGVIDSIKRGYAMIRRHLGSVASMWLVMVALCIAWMIISFIGFFILLLPLILVFLLLLLPAVLAGAILDQRVGAAVHPQRVDRNLSRIESRRDCKAGSDPTGASTQTRTPATPGGDQAGCQGCKTDQTCRKGIQAGCQSRQDCQACGADGEAQAQVNSEIARKLTQVISRPGCELPGLFHLAIRFA